MSSDLCGFLSYALFFRRPYLPLLLARVRCPPGSDSPEPANYTTFDRSNQCHLHDLFTDGERI